MVPAAPSSSDPRRRGVSLRALVTGAIVLLVLAILASAVGTLLVRHRVDTIRSQSREQLRPAQQSAGLLTTAYLDQETGLRGYLLTGDVSYLRTYEDGRHTIAGLQAQLSDLLAAFPPAIDRLETVAAAGPRWQAAAERQITARARGPLTGAAPARATRATQGEFTTLRHALDALNSEIALLLDRLIARFDAAQHQADIATIAAVALAILTALVCLVAIRRLLTRPLKSLMESVRTVAAGAYQHPVRADGSGEIALIAEAVEGMRQNIVTSGQALVEARHELTLRDERARMAADLHDLTLQNVFALGVRIDGLIAADSATAEQLLPLLDDIAQIDQELRTIVYANSAPPAEGTLLARIATVTHDSRRSLGFVPVLRLDGPLDRLTGEPAAEDLLAALRETLSNVARHAHATTVTVTITLSTGAEPVLHLQVVDNGIGLPATSTPGNGMRNLAARAAAHSGTVDTTSTPGPGTTVDWRISVPTATSLDPQPA